MDGNKEVQELDLETRKTRFENYKKFLEKGNDNVLSEIFKLAPDEKDDTSEDSRIEYIDELYKAIRDLENEFIHIVQSILGENPNIIESLHEHFAKIRNAFLLGHYESGVINSLYRKHFTDMSSKLIEKVQSEFVSHNKIREKLPNVIKESCSLNELLHVMHSYLLNDEELFKDFPVIATEKNIKGNSVTLYGEETELSRKLFDESIEYIDYVKNTEIVSMPNQILMVVKNRVTLNIRVLMNGEIDVSYSIPQIYDMKKIEALPGVFKNGISGSISIPKEKMPNAIFDFIAKIPTDNNLDDVGFLEKLSQRERECSSREDNISPIEEKLFDETDAQELAKDRGERGRRDGTIWALFEKIKSVIKGRDSTSKGDEYNK